MVTEKEEKTERETERKRDGERNGERERWRNSSFDSIAHHRTLLWSSTELPGSSRSWLTKLMTLT